MTMYDFDSERSDAGKNQKRGKENFNLVEDMIRVAIRNFGRPYSDDDDTPCYPKAALPGFLRVEAKERGTHISRTKAWADIEDLSGAHPASPFSIIRDDSNTEVIIEKPQVREEPPSRGRGRSARNT